MKATSIVSFLLIIAGAVESCGSVVKVDTVQADEVRTPILSLPPGGESDAILYYPFENSNASIALDYSTSGFDGALTGCVWVSSGRYMGGAVSFDGYGDSIAVGMEPNFPTWSQYSVSIWFLHDGGGYMGPQYGHKMLDRTSMMHDWYLMLMPVGTATGSGAIHLFMSEERNARGMGDSSKNYADNTWHHVAVVRDGPDGQFWVDGELKRAITNMIPIYSYSPLCVGNSFSNDGLQRVSWSGMLDEVQIYNRPLSAVEIGNLHSEGLLRLSALAVSTNLVVKGGVTVSETASFLGGVQYIRPQGDLSSGSYTNAP